MVRYQGRASLSAFVLIRIEDDAASVRVFDRFMTATRLHLQVDPPLFADAIAEALGWDSGGDGSLPEVYVTDHDVEQADALVLPSPCGASGPATLRVGGRSLTVNLRDVSDLIKAVGLLARVSSA